MFKTPRKGKANLTSSNPAVDLATKKAIESLERQFGEYIAGTRKKFDLKELGLHTDLRELEGTDLQRRVWVELTKIPFGKVLTYSELAIKVGNPKAVRAVASAVASNPLYIVVPCHRVVPKGRTSKVIKGDQLKVIDVKDIGNYALGSNMKKILLKIEGVI